MIRYTFFALLSLVIFAFSCTPPPVVPAEAAPLELPFEEYSVQGDSIQAELDEIYSLLAYSIVYGDWQPDSIPRFDRRGYNIGTILVNSSQEIAAWGLNCVNSMDDATQHGEVRAISSFLSSNESFNLKGFTLYTTLEPCVMCAGMATMTSVERVVYGQKDVDFSGALDRLALDSKNLGGFAPYPRVVTPDPAPTTYRNQLDAAFKYFLETEEEKFLAKFLASETAAEIYKAALDEFLTYEVEHPVNQSRYEAAVAFYKTINTDN